MTKHEIIVRGALRLYELIYTNLCDGAVMHYYYNNTSESTMMRSMVAAQARAIIAHDRHLIRFTK